MSALPDDLPDCPKPPNRAASVLLTVVGILFLIPGFCTLGLLLSIGMSPPDVPNPFSGRILPAIIGSLLSGAVAVLLFWVARRSRTGR